MKQKCTKTVIVQGTEGFSGVHPEQDGKFLLGPQKVKDAAAGSAHGGESDCRPAEGEVRKGRHG